ncbi:hypothetical protein Nitsa_0975 [Nitratifractor salsuginis DSM 16511]|uniref:Uncharacterized protein n=2 Tax=Nitratifractor salsuginis TaxID=269261 RepID=E6X3F7_NITSE|nr:hypothetical protein Nitsa_0975 [Nitratifractor salsuginis DSM 16511]
MIHYAVANREILIPNFIVIATTLVLTLLLFAKPIEKSSWWAATAIPLASIIGSGFLVVAPILQMSMGVYAPFAMTGLVTVAYLIGAAIRFNIHHVEPKLAAGTLHPAPHTLEILSQWALAFAYVVSVTYYLALFGDFALRGVNVVNPILSHTITTAILIFIAVYGRYRGFNFLGRFEAVKLGIIGGLLAGLAYGNYHAWAQQLWHLPPVKEPTLHDWRIVLGMLIVVQGFETSRYLGDKFPPMLRIRTMRYAQWISAGIYIVYITLMLYYFNYPLPPEGQDTAIITLSRHVATVLPVMLLALALIAQFDAAIADAQGGAGLFEELSKRKITVNTGYIIIAVGGILIVWSSNIFQIITYASQAFAVYYMLQSMVAALTAAKHEDIPHRWPKFFGFALVASLAATVVIFGIPAGG